MSFNWFYHSLITFLPTVQNLLHASLTVYCRITEPFCTPSSTFVNLSNYYFDCLGKVDEWAFEMHLFTRHTFQGTTQTNWDDCFVSCICPALWFGSLKFTGFHVNRSANKKKQIANLESPEITRFPKTFDCSVQPPRVPFKKSFPPSCFWSFWLTSPSKTVCVLQFLSVEVLICKLGACI